MKVKKTANGFGETACFRDSCDDTTTVKTGVRVLWIATTNNDREIVSTCLTREHVALLIAHLQAWLATGSLEMKPPVITSL